MEPRNVYSNHTNQHNSGGLKWNSSLRDVLVCSLSVSESRSLVCSFLRYFLVAKNGIIWWDLGKTRRNNSDIHKQRFFSRFLKVSWMWEVLTVPHFDADLWFLVRIEFCHSVSWMKQLTCHYTHPITTTTTYQQPQQQEQQQIVTSTLFQIKIKKSLSIFALL